MERNVTFQNIESYILMYYVSFVIEKGVVNYYEFKLLS